MKRKKQKEYIKILIGRKIGRNSTDLKNKKVQNGMKFIDLNSNQKKKIYVLIDNIQTRYKQYKYFKQIIYYIHMNHDFIHVKKNTPKF